MKRDMDLVRHVLMTVERAESEVQIDGLVVDGKWRKHQYSSAFRRLIRNKYAFVPFL